MLLEVLNQFYPDEYEMMQLLADGDYKTFNYFANSDYTMVKHLIGYGIVRELDGNYDFKIDSIAAYIKRKNNRIKISMSNEERWKEICARRNNTEIELRKMVKIILRILFKNASAAKEYIVKKIYANDKKYLIYTYDDLFDAKKSKIYLKKLTELINANWEVFSDYFKITQDKFNISMDVLNNEGRFDTHGKEVLDEDLVLVNAALKVINDGIQNFNEL